ncbi:hypothetical protein ACHAPI_005202 [Fusarium lateritium]
MAAHTFWQYLRLKAIVTLIRFLNYIGTRSHFKPSITCNRKFVRIPSRDLGRFIDSWIYYPQNYKEDEKRGLVVNWHGGACMLPNLGMDHEFCEKIANESNVLVLDADYRKAPEYPFPAAVEDVEDTLRWVESQSRLFDTERVALSGFSSGANLALVASSELKRQDLKKHSVVKFRAEASHHYHTGQFRLAVYDAYTSTIDQDRSLRDAVVDIVAKHVDLLEDSSFQKAIKDTELGIDLLMHITRESRKKLAG